jgi:ferredoxin
MKILYFTASGNSLAVAKAIGGERISIPQAVKENQFAFEDDVIGIIFPTYCCVPPRMVRDFVVKANIKADYLFAIATYGFAEGIVLEDLAARGKGTTFDYMTSIKMVDNYLPNFDISRQIDSLPKKKVDENLKVIVEDIHSRRKYIKPPKRIARLATWYCTPLLRSQETGLSAKSFIVDGKCTQCGTCAKVCPNGNIKVTDKVAFSEHCASCYACLHNCPQNAIHLPNERSEKRWRHPDVSLKEIIDSNDQSR